MMEVDEPVAVVSNEEVEAYKLHYQAKRLFQCSRDLLDPHMPPERKLGEKQIQDLLPLVQERLRRLDQWDELTHYFHPGPLEIDAEFFNVGELDLMGPQIWRRQHELVFQCQITLILTPSP